MILHVIMLRKQKSGVLSQSCTVNQSRMLESNLSDIIANGCLLWCGHTSAVMMPASLK